jgi:dienelactone hydrolase
MKRWLLLLVFLATGASAEPSRTVAAKSPFPEARDAQWREVAGPNGRKFLTAIFRPKGKGPFPAVVVLHGGDGLERAYMSLGTDLARAGFVAVIGCWQATNYVCSDATKTSEWVADPAAHSGKELIATARGLPGVRADRIGLYGLSRGGHAALWAASTGAGVQAVVVDSPAHVPAPFQIYPPPPKPLEVVSGLSAPLLIMHGTADTVIPADQSREYERAARALDKPVTAEYLDGAGHMSSLKESDARKRAIRFLEEHLLK